MNRHYLSALFLTGAAVIMGVSAPALAAGEEELYSDVISSCLRHKIEGWSIGDYLEAGISPLPFYSSSASDLGYELLDINNDGVKELVIGDINYNTVILDLYTIENGQVKHVTESLEKFTKYLTEGGMVKEVNSSGATHSSWYFYYLNGTELSPMFGIIADWAYDPYTPYFESMPGEWSHDNPLSNDEAETLLNNYPERELNLTPLTEWNPSGQTITTQSGDGLQVDMDVDQPMAESTYEFVLSDATWTEANEAAKRAGGHLVVITSEDEQKKVEKLMSSYPSVHTVWLGAERTSGKFKWVTGEKAVFAQWGKGEPNNDGGKEFYLDMYEIDGVWSWNDVPEKIDMYYSGHMGYIVEYEN